VPASDQKFVFNIMPQKFWLQLRLYFTVILFGCFSFSLRAQFTVSGTVVDISKINTVENVRVVSTGGMFAITDSLGKYHILVTEKDSLYFVFNEKPTQKFPVATVVDIQHFDISLRVPVKGKIRTLKEVTVFAKTYKQDSLENRQAYADVFNYEKPGIESSVSPSGVAGADLGQIINMFRFKRNKRLRAFQQRLEMQEQEKYVSYRFSKTHVKRVTNLQSPLLDTFLVWYRPSYEFTALCDELHFNQYILDSYYQFLEMVNNNPKRKEELP
jgi:hypothetical protein